MIYNERKAKELLKKEGFQILKSFYVSEISQIKRIFKYLKFPLVVKISGRSIFHKNRVNGVILNINSYEEILDAFGKMKRIKGFEGIVLQEQIKGKEVSLGVKKTIEFGHVIGVSSGGIDIEKIKDISFRVIPINKKDAKEMLNETEISKKLNKKEKEIIEKKILKLNSFVKKYKKILELDINPIIINNNFCRIIDSKIIFEN
jgi:acetate---CoA ligase (ADP-forming) subunit beta